VADFLVGIGTIVAVGLILLLINAVGRRLLPPASRYWGWAVALLGVGALAHLIGWDGVALACAVGFVIFGMWWVATMGAEPDPDMFRDDDGDGDGGGG
jgi:hypothetical protein